MISLQKQTPSYNRIGQRGVGHWRPALLFALLPSLLGLALLLLASAPTQAQTPSPTFSLEQVTPPTSPPAAAFGSGSFAENCAPCHGVEGFGDGPTAASMPYSPTQFADPAAVWSLSPAEFFHTTKFGRIERLMPPWRNQLSDEEIWQTVMYAWSLHTDAAFVEQGQALYGQSCAGCHGETGAGDGPDAQGDLPAFGDTVYAMVRSQEDWLAGWREAHPEIGQDWTPEAEQQVLEYIRTFSYVPAWESGYRPGPGVIRGSVVHGTEGETLPPGIVVTLDAYLHFSRAETFTTTVDAEGNFEFANLAIEGNISYIASVVMDNVRYAGPLVMLSAEAAEAETTVTVYATTAEPPNIRIDRTDWIIDDQPGALVVVQLYFFGSDGDRTFTGAPVEGIDVPASVGIHLPAGAEQVTFEGGSLGERYLQVGHVYYDTTPLSPGEGTKQIVVRYLLPYEGENAAFVQQFLYPTVQATLLVAELPQLEATIVPQGMAPWEVTESQDFQGRTYRIYRSAELPATEVDIALDGLLAANAVDPRPQPNAAGANAAGTSVTGTGSTAVPQVFAPWMAWSVGVLSLMMITGGLFWAWNNGRMQLSEHSPDLRREVDDLARRIARLDDQHALGQVPSGTWQQQRVQLKARLLELARRLKDAN